MSRGSERIVLHASRLVGPDGPHFLDVSVRSAERPLKLTVDLYDGDRPAHPDGHFSWWTWAVDGRAAFRFAITAASEPTVRLDDCAPLLHWENPQLELSSAALVDVHVTLHDLETEAVLVDRVLPWFLDAGRIERAERLLDAPAYIRRLAKPALGLRENATVHVVAPSLQVGDAIGNLSLDLARGLRHHGIPTRLWADDFGGALSGIVSATAGLCDTVRADDVLLYHYSIGDPALDPVLAAPCPKLCFYHGVTPPRLLEAIDPEAAARCERGVSELGRLAGFDGLLAASSSTAAELVRAVGEGREVRLCPPMLNLDRFAELEPAPLELPAPGRFLLYVGRFAPHKGIDLLLDAFTAYSALDPKCDLVLAGSPAGPVFGEYFAARRAAFAPEIAARVHVHAGPTDAELKTLYEACTAVVSASEHEGFGIPLVEASSFGKPVFAYDTPAVRETLGGSGGLFATRDPDALAKVWLEGLRDDAGGSNRAERAAELRTAADGAAFWEAIAEVARLSRTARPS